MQLSQNGAFQLGSSGIRFAAITDGLSNTFFVGEKHVALNRFGIGWCDCSTYNGDYWLCSTRAAGPGFELAQSLTDPRWKFGSYHTYVCQFGFGDGSVRSVPVSTNALTLALLASINDGLPIPDF